MKREAAKKAMDEEKARKEEERKKRAQEEREREQERERKKKEKEDKMKKEREEKERRAKEEREARLAKEKEEKAEKDRIEKEKKEEREKVEKEKRLAKEKEAKEKLAAQQRAAAAASASTQVSGSSKATHANNAVASSSTAPTPVKSNSSSTSSIAAPPLQRSPTISSGSNSNGTASKKPANKQIPALITNPVPPGIVGQSNRPTVQQLNLSRPPPPTPQQLPHLPPPQSAGMMYGHPQGMIPPAMSPRVGNFAPMPYGYGGPNMQQQQHHPPPPPPPPGTSLTSSGLPRFNGGSSFDPGFNRGMPIGAGVPLGSANALPPPTPSPIGPPPKTAKPATPGTTSVPPPGSAMLAPGQGRRASAPVLNLQQQGANDASGPGPITRPMAPIARPMVGGSAGGNGEATSSSSGSPSRRSPSPKGVLGSSALAADDDGVVSAHGPRRGGSTPIGIGAMPIGGGPGGQSWGGASPRTALGEGRGGPWTSSGFPSRAIPNAIGPNNHHLHQLQHASPTASPSLWGNAPPGNGNGENNWHPQSPAFFPGPPYMNHNTAASSTTHTST